MKIIIKINPTHLIKIEQQIEKNNEKKKKIKEKNEERQQILGWEEKMMFDFSSSHEQK